jgi:hypothetical protein
MFMHFLNLARILMFRCMFCNFITLCFSVMLLYNILVQSYVGRIENAGLGLAYTCVCVLVIPMAFGIILQLKILGIN